MGMHLNHNCIIIIIINITILFLILVQQQYLKEVGRVVTKPIPIEDFFPLFS